MVEKEISEMLASRAALAQLVLAQPPHCALEVGRLVRKAIGENFDALERAETGKLHVLAADSSLIAN